MKGGSFSGQGVGWSQGAAGARLVSHPMRRQVRESGLLWWLGRHEDGSQ